MSACLCAGKTKPVTAQDAFVRVCAQKCLHQRGEARLFWFFPHLHLQGFIDFWQQLAAFPVGQKTVVTHHLKMLRRDMTDIAPEHLFLRQRLLPVLLRKVVVIVVHHGTAGLLRKMDLPASPVLRFQIAAPLFFVSNMAQARQAAGIYQVMAVAQQADDGATPDFLHGMLLKEEVTPEAMFHVESATGDGEVNVRVLVELSAVRMQGAEDTDLHALFAGPPEHGSRSRTEQGIKQGPVVIEEGPQQMGHGESDVLPVAVGKNMALLRHPLFRGFEATGAAGF